jgi:hypothetical protein
MANILNEGLSRTLGIEFEFKLKLQTLLAEYQGAPLVQAEAAEAAAALVALNKFIGCGPSMGFEAKRFAYGAFEQIIAALQASATVPAADKTALTSELVNVTRYVGLEGEEDFHFMVAAFNLCELISGIIGETETEVVEGVAAIGAIAAVVLLDGGSDYTTDGTVDTAPSVIYNLEGTEDAGNGTGATADVAIASGVVTSITTASGGSGYSVGDILVLGVSGAQTLGTPAIVEVTAIS